MHAAIKEKYKNTNIILCFYHFINRIKVHIKSKFKGSKSVYKKLYSDLLCNIRLLSFIDIDIINNFLDTLEKKYKKIFSNFSNISKEIL